MTRPTRFLLALATLFAAGCVMPPPEIKSLYLGSGLPTPRPDSSQVEVFLRSDPPQRAFSSIGEVEITTQRSKRSMANMLDYARREARKLGADALIIETGAVAVAGNTVPVRNLYTGQVMFYRNDSGTRRTLKGSAIVWK